MGRTKGKQVAASLQVDGAITGSVARDSQQRRNVFVAWKKIEPEFVERICRHPSVLGAWGQENVLKELGSQWRSMAEELREPAPDMFIIARMPILPTNPSPETFGSDLGAGFENTNHQAPHQVLHPT